MIWLVLQSVILIDVLVVPVQLSSSVRWLALIAPDLILNLLNPPHPSCKGAGRPTSCWTTPITCFRCFKLLMTRPASWCCVYYCICLTWSPISAIYYNLSSALHILGTRWFFFTSTTTSTLRRSWLLRLGLCVSLYADCFTFIRKKIFPLRDFSTSVHSTHKIRSCQLSLRYSLLNSPVTWTCFGPISIMITSWTLRQSWLFSGLGLCVGPPCCIDFRLFTHRLSDARFSIPCNSLLKPLVSGRSVTKLLSFQRINMVQSHRFSSTPSHTRYSLLHVPTSYYQRSYPQLNLYSNIHCL